MDLNGHDNSPKATYEGTTLSNVDTGFDVNYNASAVSNRYLRGNTLRSAAGKCRGAQHGNHAYSMYSLAGQWWKKKPLIAASFTPQYSHTTPLLPRYSPAPASTSFDLFPSIHDLNCQHIDGLEYRNCRALVMLLTDQISDRWGPLDGWHTWRHANARNPRIVLLQPTNAL